MDGSESFLQAVTNLNRSDYQHDRMKPGPEQKLSFAEEFFPVLVKLKTGRMNEDLALHFGDCAGLVSSSHPGFLFSMQNINYCSRWPTPAMLMTCQVSSRDISDLRVLIDCT